MTLSMTKTPAMTTLSAFQRDLLWVLSHEDEQKGLAIKRDIEMYYSEDISHARVYQNLDALAEEHLVEKRSRDRRTNEYCLTPRGRSVLAARRAWILQE